VRYASDDAMNECYRGKYIVFSYVGFGVSLNPFGKLYMGKLIKS
jgi:hypothetical protein